MTIYIDVLIILNIYVNFFLLLATARLRNLRLTVPRCIITSVFASLFSLVIFVPSMNIVAEGIFRVFSAFLVVLCGFGFGGFKVYLKNTFFFFAVNFVFSGVVSALMTTLNSSVMYFRNAVLYIDLSPVVLIIGTALAYAVINIVGRIFRKNDISDSRYSVIVSAFGKTVKMKALADTGNNLTDVFSGAPVIICDSEKLGVSADASMIGEIKGARLLPYSTIDNDGLIPVFRPSYVCVKNETSGVVKEVTALIGVTSKNKECEAVFNPKILA